MKIEIIKGTIERVFEKEGDFIDPVFRYFGELIVLITYYEKVADGKR